MKQFLPCEQRGLHGHHHTAAIYILYIETRVICSDGETGLTKA